MTLNVDMRWVIHSALGQELYLGVALLLTTCCLNPVSVSKSGSLSNMNDTAISLAVQVSLCGVLAIKSIVGIMIAWSRICVDTGVHTALGQLLMSTC